MPHTSIAVAHAVLIVITITALGPLLFLLINTMGHEIRNHRVIMRAYYRRGAAEAPSSTQPANPGGLDQPTQPIPTRPDPQ